MFLGPYSQKQQLLKPCSILLLQLLFLFLQSALAADPWYGPEGGVENIVVSDQSTTTQTLWYAKQSTAGATSTYTVYSAAPAAMPTLVYNCYNMPAICNNVAQKAGPHPVNSIYFYDRHEGRKIGRRGIACPSGWIGGDGVPNRCPEPNQPIVVASTYIESDDIIDEQGRIFRDKALQRVPAMMEIQQDGTPSKRTLVKRMSKLDSNGVAQLVYIPLGVHLTCDEFPPATWTGGGIGAVSYCAPEGKTCDYVPLSEEHDAGRSYAGFSEQNWQGHAHNSLSAYMRGVMGARANSKTPRNTVFAFKFETVYQVNDNDAAWVAVGGVIRYVYGPGHDQQTRYIGDVPQQSERRSIYPMEIKGIANDTLWELDEKRSNIFRRDYLAPGPDINTTTVVTAPVQQEPALAPALPIIEISEQYILGQINRNATLKHNASLADGQAPQRRWARPISPGLTRYTSLHKRVEGPVQCSPEMACADGSCCNTDGKCGFKDAHCGASCISNCDAKAMCGIDSEGGNKKCALNLCCSYYGWCGTESVHCIDPEPQFGLTPCQQGFGGCAIIPPPVCGEGSGTANGRKIAYYQSWNVRERQCNRIRPYQIDTTGLTHLYFAFAFIDPVSFKVVPMNSEDTGLYTEFTALKKPGLQTWIAIGGFSMSDPGPTRTTWSDMAATTASRATFIASVISFMNQWGFQGVDLDWEYPGSPERGGKDEDVANLVLLVKEMRAAFGSTYGLSSILAPDYWYLRGFDAKAMEPYVDWFGFMAYDLHGFWDADVKTLGKIVRPQTDIREIDKGLLPLWFAGVNPAKVNFGMAYYGRGYTLSDPACPWMGCSFAGPSKSGTCTGFEGVLSNLEIRQLIKDKNIVPDLIADAMVKQISWDGDQWMGYDDEETLALKLKYANNRCLGGTMIWSIDFDSGIGSGSNPVIGDHISPESATVIPLAGTTLVPTATFTLGSATTPDVYSLAKDGNQNSPSGPGSGVCLTCDLARLITSTCCGTGGGVSNPIEISADTVLLQDLILPAGFIPNQTFQDNNGATHPANTPLESETVIPVGTIFDTPFEIPAGLQLSSRASWDGSISDITTVKMYIITTFWEQEHLTVTCSYPCTFLLPPYPVITTWTPPLITTTIDGTSYTVTPPVMTTEKIRIPEMTVTSEAGSSPTKTVRPGSGGPMCPHITIHLLLIDITFQLCPPSPIPFPTIPLVTIVPVPPGGAPGPTNPANKPSQDQEDEEDDEDEDEIEGGGYCALTPDGNDDDRDTDGSEGDSGGDSGDSGTTGGSSVGTTGSSNSGGTAGPGNGGSTTGGGNKGTTIGGNKPSTTEEGSKPSTTEEGSKPSTTGGGSKGTTGGGGGKSTITVTAGPTQTVTEINTTIIAVTPTSKPSPPVSSPSPDPSPPTPQPDTEKTGCYTSGRDVDGWYLERAVDVFCENKTGEVISNNRLIEIAVDGGPWADVTVSVQGLNNCKFTIEKNDCKRVMMKAADCHKPAMLLRVGGKITSNCAVWRVDPNSKWDWDCLPFTPISLLYCALIE